MNVDCQTRQSKSKCSYCDQRAVVAVLDKHIELSDVDGGNKYWLFCSADDCQSWISMCSEERFRTAQRQFVLPVDADRENAPDSLVAFADYDYGPEIEELLEKRVRQGDSNEENESGQNRGSDEQDDDEINEFACPACDHEQTGYPSHCRECGVEYDWPEGETQ